MESPPVARYIPQKSKKRVFPGGSSSCVDSEVVEISPPNSWAPRIKSSKQKQVIHHEVIDVDEDCGDVILCEGKVDTKNKGKEALVNFAIGPGGGANIGSVDGVQSSRKSCSSVLHTIIDLDGSSSGLPSGDDEFVDMYFENLMYDDEYAVLQSHFDNMDLPTGVEAPIPWLNDPAQIKKKIAGVSSSTYLTMPIEQGSVGFPPAKVLSQSLPIRGVESTMSTLKSSSSSQPQLDVVGSHHIANMHSSWSFAEPVPSQNKSAVSTSSTNMNLQSQRGAVNLPSGVGPFKSQHFGESSHNKWKSSATYNNSHSQWGSMKLLARTEPSIKQVNGNLTYANNYMPVNKDNQPPGVGASMSAWLDCHLIETESYISDPPQSNVIDPSDVVHSFPEVEASHPWAQVPGKSQKGATAAGSLTVALGSSSSSEKSGSMDDIFKKFNLFKKFDTVQDHSDHHYSRNGSLAMQPSKSWAKKIQEDWRILEKDLPDAIFVRVYESRMDLLRAVIIGAEGTPYHDGLFFFDVYFPPSYPSVPPHVHYHSGGLRINPNLYNCGKVCLSLLNTWSGDRKEKWIPRVSTMLQVLVSIQGLILNAKPYFNEPGYANMRGTPRGEQSSESYNENTFILSLKTMVYTMHRPPKYFKAFVVGHFCKRARDILVACKSYTEGAQVGCLVKGGVQDLDEGDKSCSQAFKHNLAGYISTLVKTFSEIGAKDCEEFFYLAQQGNGQASTLPDATDYSSTNYTNYYSPNYY